MYGKYENIKYMIVTQVAVYDSILSRHVGKRNACLVKTVDLGQKSSNVSSFTHHCECLGDGNNSMEAI